MEEEELHIVKDVKMDVCGESMNYGAGGRPGKRGNLCLRSETPYSARDPTVFVKPGKLLSVLLLNSLPLPSCYT